MALLVHALLLLGIAFYPAQPRPQPVVHSLTVALIPNAAGPDEALRAPPESAQPHAALTPLSVAAVEPVVEPEPVEAVVDPVPEPAGPTPEESFQEVIATQTPQETATGQGPTPPSPARPASTPQPQLRASDLLASGLAIAQEGSRPATSNSRERHIPSQGATTLEQFYLDAWARKVEQIGAMNFPDAALQYSSIRCPTLHVALRADGSLEELRIARPCRDAALNEAALGMVRMAAPFAPFPPELRSRWDVLRFDRVLVFQQ